MQEPQESLLSKPLVPKVAWGARAESALMVPWAMTAPRRTLRLALPALPQAAVEPEMALRHRSPGPGSPA